MASASPVGQEEEAGWPAVSRCISYLLGTSEHGTKPPPVLVEFGGQLPNVLLPGAAAGLLHGGINKWLEERSEGPPPVSVHSRMQRLFRVSDAALRRGLTMGSLAGLYVGVQALLAVHRGRRSYLPDSFCGGAAVAGVYAGYRAVNATQWPPARLPKDLMIIVGMGLVFGLLDQQYQRELAAAAAAEAEKEVERLRAEAAASRRDDAAATLLAQLQASLGSGNSSCGDGSGGGGGSPQLHQAGGEQWQQDGDSSSGGVAQADGLGGAEQQPGGRWWQLWRRE